MRTAMGPDEALRRLLRENPDAIIAAVGARATLVPMPDSVPRDGHHVFEGRLGLDLLVADDQVLIADAWSRVLEEPIMRMDVHLLADPDRVATMHVFDVRAQHGVHVLVLEGQDIETLLRSSDARAALRRTMALVKRDAVATFLAVDDATTTLLGWNADELVGRSTLEFIHPDDTEPAIDTWMEMRGAGRSRGRVRLRHADGHYVWVEISNDNRLDDPAHGCVLSEIIDFSDEMAHLEALHERERQLARLAEALPIGICHLRPDRSIGYTNEPLAALLGPIGTLDALLDHIAPDDRPAVEAALDVAFTGTAAHHEVTLVGAGDERRCELTFRAMPNDDGTLDGVIVCAGDVTDRSRLRAELEHRADHDDLTGCLNRAATATAVERFLRESRSVTVAFIDLDGFKITNDEIGHAAGDELLRIAAARLRSVTRDHDLLGRLGGDEFVVVCPAVDTALDPDELTHRLTDALNGTVDVGRQRVVLRASVGAASSVVGELGAEGLLQRADAAMYTAKRKARTQCVAV